MLVRNSRNSDRCRLYSVVAVLAVAMLILVAGGPVQAQETTFRAAIGIDPDTLDPAGQTTTTVANMVDYVVETLTIHDAEGALQPGLAREWEVSNDGLTITFFLEEGVLFHDGNPLDADAVKFTIERILDPDVTSPQRAPFAPVDEIEVIDSHTVALHLNSTAPYMVSALAMTQAGIISPASVDAHGNTYTDYRHPVGTGPYNFQSYRAGDQLQVAKFADYWGEIPYYDRVVFHIVPEAATRVAMVLAGDADMMILPPIADVPSLQANPDVEVRLAPSNRVIFVTLNNAAPELQDPRVRQALNYAVDKDLIIDAILFGAADPVRSPVDDAMFGYCEVGSYDYDPDRARQLLAEAGAEGLQLDFIAPTGRYVQDFEAAQAISGMLEEVGVSASVRTMDWPSYVGTIVQPPDEQSVHMHLLGWGPQFLDALQSMLMFESRYHPPNGLATSFYANAEVDDLLARAASEVDLEKRANLYCQAQEIVHDEAAWLYLWSQRFPIVYSSDLEGISSQVIEKFDAVYARPRD